MLSPAVGTVIGDYLIGQIALMLSRKGHNLTGDLIKSLEFKVRTYADGLTLEFFSNEYGHYLNAGIPPSRIPYTPGRRRGQGSSGSTSKFIQGLIRYAQRRFGLRGREAISAAFGMATNMKRRGLTASRWLDEILEEQEEVITRLVEKWAGEELEKLVVSYVTQKIAA